MTSDVERDGGRHCPAPSTPVPPAGNRAGPAVSLSVALQLVRELRLDVARLRLKLLADVPRD